MSDLEKRLDQIEQKIDASTRTPSPYYDTGTQQNRNDEIDLRELWSILWQGKGWILGITCLFAITGVLYALSLPNMYTSGGVYAPAQRGDGGGTLSGQLGGLASIAGINLGGGESNDIDQAMVLLTSWPFLEAIIEENILGPYILAVEEWNKETGELVWNDELYDSQSQQWKITDPQKAADPSSYELYRAFSQMLDTTVGAKTGMVTISVTHYSPVIAERWVHLLVRAINQHFQKRDIVEAKRNIDYLENKIGETSITELKSVFYEMIESQMRKLMLAEVSDSYLFREVVPAKIAEQKSKPPKALICILFVTIGGFLSCLFVLILGALKSPKGHNKRIER